MTVATPQAPETGTSPFRVSRSELSRRWLAVREAVEAQGIDVLLTEARDEFVGGYVRYLSDLVTTGGFKTTLVFSRDDEAVAVMSGPPAEFRTDPGVDDAWRGVSRVITTPSFAAVQHTDIEEQRCVIRAFAGFDAATVGLLGQQLISVTTINALRETYPNMRFVDASNLVDRIRVVKSDEERELLRLTGQQQDAAVAAVFDEIKPGMKERDVLIRAQEIVSTSGSTQGLYVVGSGNADVLATVKPFGQQHRVLEDGDMLHLLIESNGPGGLYTEISRTVVLGTAPQALKEELEFALAAQKFTMDRLRPGAKPADVWNDYNAFMRANGRPKENRLHCHAQGYDIVEPPLLLEGETMPIQAGMNIACHPAYSYAGYWNWICDNYLITEDGVEQLTVLPALIYEL